MNLGSPVSSLVPSLEGRVLQVLSHTTTSLTGARVAALASGGSTAGTRLALSRLVKQGLVRARPAGPSVLYELRREHLLWPAVDALVTAAEGVRAELFARITALVHEVLEDDADMATVALFGSVARGTADADSDVDLVLITPDGVSPHAVEALCQVLTARVEAWTGNRCAVIDLTQGELLAMVDAGDPLVGSWRRDAVTVCGPELTSRMEGESCLA